MKRSSYASIRSGHAMLNRRIVHIVLFTSGIAAMACTDVAAPSREIIPVGSSRQGGVGGGGGGVGGGGGGGGTVALPNPLPTSAPAPDILVRESFGPGPDLVRPTGGKGTLKATSLHTTINGFWAEWPGSSKTQWIAPDVGQTWK